MVHILMNLDSGSLDYNNNKNALSESSLPLQLSAHLILASQMA